jgi:drug/metabolite transporter (DMT)-like permease
MTQRAAGRRAELLGGALIGAAALQFGAVVLFGTLLTRDGFPVTVFLGIRFLGAAVFLAVMLMVLKRPLLAAPGEGVPLLLLGVFGYAVESGLFFGAVQHGSAPAATLLFFTYPVWVSLIWVVIRRVLPERLVLVSLGVSVTGAAIVVLGSGGLDISTAGILFAFGSSLTFALYLIAADRVLKRSDSMTGAMWVALSSGAALALVSVIAGVWQWPSGWEQWGSTLGSAALTAGAFFGLFAGLRRLGPVRASVISASEPFWATVLTVAFLGEPLHRSTAVGGVFILAGAVMASLVRSRQVTESLAP